MGRALIGVGMAGVLMGSLKIFSQWFPARRFATVSGMLVGIGSLGALFAATPMALLNNQFGWRSIFLAGCVLTVLIALVDHAVDAQHAAGRGVARRRRRSGQPARGVHDRRLWRIAPLTFFLAGTMLGFQGLWSGPYLYDTQGLTDVQVGNVILLLGVGSTLGFLSSGWLADRFGLARVIVVMSAVFVLCQVGTGDDSVCRRRSVRSISCSGTPAHST